MSEKTEIYHMRREELIYEVDHLSRLVGEKDAEIERLTAALEAAAADFRAYGYPEAMRRARRALEDKPATGPPDNGEDVGVGSLVGGKITGGGLLEQTSASPHRTRPSNPLIEKSRHRAIPRFLRACAVRRGISCALNQTSPLMTLYHCL